MYQYRVTKYDPSLRGEGGAYLGDDWTSRSDIGKTFGGTPLTEDRYLHIEQSYLKAAAAFLNEAGVTELTVVGLENHRQSAAAPRNGSLIKLEEVPAVLRSLLREEFWCKLEGPSSFIHVGYDYYMYVGTPIECTSASDFAQRSELFVEAFKSPYA
jgi:hypothetical protein